ncbi:unnamed protein product [Spirodela intermedia]|uniref:Protein kinase domain-containing protein n=1 Tax=Spirodela intermedia TaxID=51605 RepID=A0A7I8JHY1_SPIIN|nr:unnamed protein product [Spirodela intermedia]CAA6669764.1 unnamed protein product [Spirodela intermedia]
MKCFSFFRERTRGRSSAAPAKLAAKPPSYPSCPSSSPRSISDLYEEKAGALRVFDLSELRGATNDFSRLLKIGQGGFGAVYKVKLIGYCAVDGEKEIQRLLVYEFMPNKSLEQHLFNGAYPALSWERRLKIAMGVAEGLRYLHEGLEIQVIFRDFKASNILLDKEFNPKLSDFGLARQGPSDGRSHVTTAVVGTYGYAAPDYIKSGHLTIKSDVWSFGVVLYEILTGRRTLDKTRPKPEQKLLDWVKKIPIESKRFSEIMDPRLRNEYSISAARLLAKLANSCLLKNPKDRPSMCEVLETLAQAIQITTDAGSPTENH